MTDTLPPDAPRSRPAHRWRDAVRDWTVPQAIRDKSPYPEWSLEPSMFRWKPEEDAKRSVRPSRTRALEALPEGGAVLDVGVGGGASSLGLAPRAGLIIGVDRLEGMLESFRASAALAGVAAKAVLGDWPDVADQVEPVDVAVCHHAIYGVAEIEPFLEALTATARHRVVLELSAHPPMVGLNPMWRSIHGIERPDRLVADDAEEVLLDMGMKVERENFVVPAGPPQEVTTERIAFSRRRLCVGTEYDEEIAAFLATLKPQDQDVVALWWPGSV